MQVQGTTEHVSKLDRETSRKGSFAASCSATSGTSIGGRTQGAIAAIWTTTSSASFG